MAILSNPKDLQETDKVVIAGFGFDEINHPLANGGEESSSLYSLRSYPTIVTAAPDPEIQKLELFAKRNKDNRDVFDGAKRGDSGGPAYVYLNGNLVLAGICSGSYLSDEFEVRDPAKPQSEFGNQDAYEFLPSYKEWLIQTAKKFSADLAFAP